MERFGFAALCGSDLGCSKIPENAAVLRQESVGREMTNSITKAQLFGLFKMRKNSPEQESELSRPLRAPAAAEEIQL